MTPIDPRAKGGWSIVKRQRFKCDGIPEHTPQPFPAAVKLGNVWRIMERAGGNAADKKLIFEDNARRLIGLKAQ
jgi:hypothetical protein